MGRSPGKPPRIFNDAERADIIARRLAGESYESIQRLYHCARRSIKPLMVGIAPAPKPKACLSINCERRGQILPVSDFLPKPSAYDGLDALCSRCRLRRMMEECLIDRRTATRDVPPYDYECPVCGMGVNQRGRKFETYDEALQCCIGRGVEVMKARNLNKGRPRMYDRGRATGLLQRILRGSR